MTTFRPEPDPGDAAARVEAEAAVIEAIVQTDRLISTLTAAKLRLIEFARQTQVGTLSHALAEREFRAEIATALRISERAADILIDEAGVLVQYLPATHAALADGRITPRQARVIVDELARVDEAERGDLERRALEAADQSSTAFARTLRRMRETRDAGRAIERHQKARADRHVSCEPGADGMAWITACLPAVDALAIDSRLDDLARGLASRHGDDRTVAQLRADAFGDVLLDRDGRAFRRFGDARPTVVVTVPISVLTGASETGAELTGYGPIDAQTARDLAAEAPTLRRMFTDPRDDTMLALGRTKYRVSDELRLFLTVRDERCRFPHCGRRAAAADIDHTRAWEHGGATDPGNLAHLCRGHHRLKHGSRWRIEATHPDGTLDWVSPTGRRHRTRPARAVGASEIRNDSDIRSDSDPP
ncbi:DUF222 domain-containing protein [Pseudolysinimonas sp.]|jgi:hypothetical protein|uniref:HNH endonuclease signature motif containing protein n=1 Tax=Pseudolysinimonas sp. TaxID=2680009 RepID=UPI0037831078